jgi:hypothetical protein
MIIFIMLAIVYFHSNDVLRGYEKAMREIKEDRERYCQ